MKNFETLWSDSLAGFFLAQTDGTFIDTNDSFVDMFGYSTDYLYKLGLNSCFGGQEAFDEFFKLLQNKRSVKNYLVKSVGHNGVGILFKTNARIIHDDNGSEQIVGSVIDLTELSVSKRSQLETQRTFQDLFENSLELIQSFDMTGRLLFCNKTWHEKLEYSSEDLSGITLFDIIAPEHHHHCHDIFMEVLQGKRFVNIEVDFVSKSGRRISLEGNIVPLIRNGKLEATHGFFRDVTEKNKAQQIALAHEKLLQTIFDSLPVCMYVKDVSDRYIFSNAYMEQTMGRAIAGLADADLFPSEVLEILHKADADALAQPTDLISFSIDISGKEGDSHYHCGKKAIVQGSGVGQVFGFFIDVSELVENTRRIQGSEQMLQFIINNIDEGLLLYSKKNSPQYHLVYRNNKVSELTSNEQDFLRIDDLLHYLSIDFSKDLNFLKTAEFKCERELQTRVGLVSVIVRVNEIRESIHDSHILISLYDNTKDKKLLQDIETKYNENLVLIGEVHHRVKNNLAIIDGIFELKKAQLSDSASKQLISEMQLRVKSIALVHQKLYNALDFATISFHDYVQDMAIYYKKLYSTDSILAVNFDFKINKTISLDITSSISLGLLISELVSNSLKYGAVEGKVKIAIGLDFCDKGLCFTYSDSGPGIPGEFSENTHYGFGFKLMQSLQKQLKGNASVSGEGHFSYQLTFPLVQSYVKKAHHYR